MQTTRNPHIETKEQLLIRNYFNFIIGLYVGISSVYWLPNVEVSTLKVFKYIVYASIFLSALLFNTRIKHWDFSSGLTGVAGSILLLICYWNGILNASGQVLVDILANISSMYLFIWLISTLSINNLIVPKQIYSNALLVFTPVVLYHVIISATKIFEVQIPETESNYETFIDIGFNLSRTGWSNGLALFIPLCFLNKNQFVRWIVLFLVMYSQYLSGGRTGLFAGVFIVVLILYEKRLFFSSIVFVLVVTLFTVYNLEEITTSLRFDRLGSNNSAGNLNDFSANRLVGMQYGIEKWLSAPLTGNGIGNVNVSKITGANEIHNFWIRTLAESGILPTLFLLLFVLSLLYKSRKYGTDNGISFSILLGGFIMTFFEPNALFGSFQNYAIWWLAVGHTIIQGNFKKKSVIIPQKSD